MKLRFKTPDFIKRKGPVLVPDQVPYECALTFNAGVSRWQEGGYVMLFRNDYGFSKEDYDAVYEGKAKRLPPTKSNFGLAFSSDGLNWKIKPEPVFSMSGNGIKRAYDPRITPLENGDYGVCFAVESVAGIRGGVSVTKDFKTFDIKDLSVPVNRNMALFPEKINGEYVRLERPFLVNDQYHSIWLSRSPDLIHWGESELVLDCRSLPYADLKIGPAAPPVKTPQGWLTTIHGVEVQDQPFPGWTRTWSRCYYGGLMLLDLENPAKIIALADIPFLVPEEPYEIEGYRGGVIFPGAMIFEPDGTAKIYYGAADTVECLAEAKISDLIDFCFEHNIANKI